jgi:hypothetical protein
MQVQSCGADSATDEQPTEDASSGGSGLTDSSAEGSFGGSKAGSGGSKAGSGGAQAGSAGSLAGSGGSKAGNGGADAGAGKGGSAGVDAGKGGADASAGKGGSSTDGGAGADGSPPDSADGDAPGDAAAESDAAAVCALKTADAACQACMLTNCNDPCLTCEKNPFCAAIIACVGACADDACKKQCWDNNKDGQTDFNAFASQSGCLQAQCATECPGLPNTGGCTVAAHRRGETGWLLLAAMLGLARMCTRRRSER